MSKQTKDSIIKKTLIRAEEFDEILEFANQIIPMTPTDYISREQEIRDILIPAFWATTILTIMDWRCTDGVIKIRDEAIDAIIALPDKSLQIREMVEKKITFDPQDEFSSWYKKMWEELLSEIYSL
jgi:hypothetical protein